jgi:type I restriction enzyme R subunit
VYRSVNREYRHMPMVYDSLWLLVASVKGNQDLEQHRQMLMPDLANNSGGKAYDRWQKIRENFYAALTEFRLLCQGGVVVTRLSRG